MIHRRRARSNIRMNIGPQNHLRRTRPCKEEARRRLASVGTASDIRLDGTRWSRTRRNNRADGPASGASAASIARSLGRRFRANHSPRIAENHRFSRKVRKRRRCAVRGVARSCQRLSRALRTCSRAGRERERVDGSRGRDRRLVTRWPIVRSRRRGRVDACPRSVRAGPMRTGVRQRCAGGSSRIESRSTRMGLVFRMQAPASRTADAVRHPCSRGVRRPPRPSRRRSAMTCRTPGACRATPIADAHRHWASVSARIATICKNANRPVFRRYTARRHGM